VAELVEVAVKAYSHELKSVSEVKSVQVTIHVHTADIQGHHARSFLKLKPDSTKSFQEMLQPSVDDVGRHQTKELEQVELILNHD
jgi:hypothetical protein